MPSQQKNTSAKIFSAIEEEAIKLAIAHAEILTSGEISLFMDDHCKGDPVKKATEIFLKLGMDKTKLRNGVLFYLSHQDHKFAIIGDKGIHEKVGDEFWFETKELMLEFFKNQRVVEGLVAGIKKAGEALATLFPAHVEDVNEITNDINYRS